MTPSQKEWITEMYGQGYRALVCLGVDSAMSELDAYMALPPTRAAVKEHACSGSITWDGDVDESSV